MRWNWDHPTSLCRWEPPWTSASSWRCSSAPSPVSSASVWSLSGSSSSSLTPTPRSPGDHLCDVQAEPQASEANGLEPVFLRTRLPETSIYLKPVSGAICLEILWKQLFAENDSHPRSSRYVVPPSPRPVINTIFITIVFLLLTAYIIIIDHHSKGAIPTVESDNHIHRQRTWTGILF